MIDPLIAEAILTDQRIAYALTDRDLKVVALGGAVDLLYADHSTWLGGCLPDLVPELVGSEPILQEIIAGSSARFELALVNRAAETGQTIYLSIAELPYRDRAGRIAGLIHLVGDETETGTLKQRLTQQRNELLLLRDQLNRQNKELEVALSELKQLDELKSRFISVAAHELRNPLATISGFVEVLLEEDISPLTADQRQYLEIVRDGTNRMLNITTSLLDVNRIEAGRVELNLQPANLAALVEVVGARYQPSLEVKGKTLAFHIAPDLPLALCDERRAGQVIDNLLSNAAKYTPPGGLIIVGVALAGDPDFIQVSVTDTGIGIPPADQAKIFNRFFRAGNAASTGASGTGLGLYLSRCLIELHGGRLWFTSELNRGSTFYATFPTA